MTYQTHAVLAENGDLRRRFFACAAQEKVPNAQDWVTRNAWYLIGTDMTAAYESAEANDAYEGNPALDPAVITDQMILSSVQARVAEQKAAQAAAEAEAAKAAEQKA